MKNGFKVIGLKNKEAERKMSRTTVTGEEEREEEKVEEEEEEVKNAKW